jgi:hypothetical protein
MLLFLVLRSSRDERGLIFFCEVLLGMTLLILLGELLLRLVCLLRLLLSASRSLRLEDCWGRFKGRGILTAAHIGIIFTLSLLRPDLL